MLLGHVLAAQARGQGLADPLSHRSRRLCFKLRFAIAPDVRAARAIVGCCRLPQLKLLVVCRIALRPDGAVCQLVVALRVELALGALDAEE